jgi:hypothetical protein
MIGSYGEDYTTREVFSYPILGQKLKSLTVDCKIHDLERLSPAPIMELSELYPSLERIDIAFTPQAGDLNCPKLRSLTLRIRRPRVVEACIEFVCNVLNGGGTPNLQVLQLLVYSEGLNEVKETLNAYEGARTTDIQLIFTEYEVDPEDTDIRDEVRRTAPGRTVGDKGG